MPTSSTPLFIVIDGVDGCGKTTQARLLVENLRERTGVLPLHLREPGSTPLGESLRDLLLSRESTMSPSVEALLLAASRRQMLEQQVLPALAEERHVVCERFHPSTFAYQALVRSFSAPAGAAWSEPHTILVLP